jgi:hypothetical protein
MESKVLHEFALIVSSYYFEKQAFSLTARLRKNAASSSRKNKYRISEVESSVYSTGLATGLPNECKYYLENNFSGTWIECSGFVLILEDSSRPSSNFSSILINGGPLNCVSADFI